jgi:hypothetical protein
VNCISVIEPSEDTYSYMGQGCAKDLRKLWDDAEGDDRVLRVAFAPGGGRFVFTQGGATTFEGLPVSLTDKLISGRRTRMNLKLSSCLSGWTATGL